MGDADATSLLRGMSSRASRVEAEITRRLRSEFASLLKPRQHHLGGGAPQMAVGGGGGGGGVGAGTEAGDGVVRESRRQALLSCLRPFSALGSGIEAEKQFARLACEGIGRVVWRQLSLALERVVLCRTLKEARLFAVVGGVDRAVCGESDVRNTVFRVRLSFFFLFVISYLVSGAVSLFRCGPLCQSRPHSISSVRDDCFAAAVLFAVAFIGVAIVAPAAL